MIGMIVAVSPEGVIGVGEKIPWHHPGDQRRFFRVTRDATVIMGRRTFEGAGGKPLPKRRNIIVTHAALAGVECAASLSAALALAGHADIWICGGAKIYEEAMPLADIIDVTYVPDQVSAPDAVYFPKIDERLFEAGPLLPHEEEPGLFRRTYKKIRRANE